MSSSKFNFSISNKFFIGLFAAALTPVALSVIIFFLFFPHSFRLVPASEIIFFISVFVFSCFIIAALFAFYLNRRIISPIKNISELVRKAKDGEIENNVRLDSSANDEIGKLASLFNEFMHSLTTKEEHEKQIEQQKIELELLNKKLQIENSERIKSEEKIQEMMLDLAEFAKTLEDKVDQSVNELREKDALLIKQSGLAAMGEMIGNIAHQWRQPINAVGLIIQNIQEAYEYEDLTKEYLDQNVKKAMDIIQFMSQTINDFRNFFKPEKEKQDFFVYDSIIKSVSLIEASFKSSAIEVVVNKKDDAKIFGYPNEYSQVILNILNNAKDVLIEKKIANPYVIISISSVSDNSTLVTVEDNAGGIPDNIIDKIFEPYFTTKDQGKGTGLGLYMSKTIIEKNMDGKLSVSNGKNGAIFKIEN